MVDTMGRSNQNIFVPTIWAAMALGLFHANAVMARLVNRDFEDEIKQKGNTINVGERGVLTANDKVEGTGVTLQNPQGSQHTLTLNKHKEVSFIVEDVLEAVSAVKNQIGYMVDAIKVLSKTVDGDLTGLYTLAGNTVTKEGAITETEVGAAWTYLEDNEIPENDRFFVISPNQYADMLAINRFSDASVIARSGVIAEGALGRIYGFDVFSDSRIKRTGSSAEYYEAMAFQRNGICLATRPLALPPPGLGARGVYQAQDGIVLRLLYAYNPDHLGVQCTCDILYVFMAMRNACIVEVKTK